MLITDASGSVYDDTNMELTSTAFENGSPMPAHYSCDGANTNPELIITGVPESARSLALIMDDPDVPRELKPDGVFDHWVLFNIPPAVTSIPADMKPDSIPHVRGANGRGVLGYVGPCPPPQYEPQEHRYVFTLYALDAELDLREGATKAEVLEAMSHRASEHVIAKATLIGKYRRQEP
jgi:Raf kinase inhibitor-like YbhB/YbcL family protein